VILLGLVLAACTPPPATTPPPARMPPTATQPAAVNGPDTPAPLTLYSPAFQDGAVIPSRFTCAGADVSPPLSWSGQPAGTASLALVLEDPDAPGGTWVHWVVFNLPLEVLGLQEGVGGQADLGGLGVSGTNSWGEPQYGGPCPPSGTHHYVFHLYALDRPLDLVEGATLDDLQHAMVGHVLAEAQLTGTASSG